MLIYASLLYIIYILAQKPLYKKGFFMKFIQVAQSVSKACLFVKNHQHRNFTRITSPAMFSISCVGISISSHGKNQGNSFFTKDCVGCTNMEWITYVHGSNSTSLTSPIILPSITLITCLPQISVYFNSITCFSICPVSADVA